MSAYVGQAGEHQQLRWLGGSTMEVLLDAQATNGQLMVVRNTMQRGDGPPLHVHHGEDEMFLLLSGAGSFWYGEEQHDLTEGGIVFLPRDVPHTFLITETADVLTMTTPGGFETFFRTAGHDLAVPEPGGFAVDVPAMAAAAGLVGLEILGPPRRLPD